MAALLNSGTLQPSAGFPVYMIKYYWAQCGLFCLLGRDQKIEMKLGCENIMSQNTGCLLISVACFGVNNFVIFWNLRAEILNT